MRLMGLLRTPVTAFETRKQFSMPSLLHFFFVFYLLLRMIHHATQEYHGVEGMPLLTSALWTAWPPYVINSSWVLSTR